MFNFLFFIVVFTFAGLGIGAVVEYKNPKGAGKVLGTIIVIICFFIGIGAGIENFKNKSWM